MPQNPLNLTHLDVAQTVAKGEEKVNFQGYFLLKR